MWEKNLANGEIFYPVLFFNHFNRPASDLSAINRKMEAIRGVNPKFMAPIIGYRVARIAYYEGGIKRFGTLFFVELLPLNSMSYGATNLLGVRNPAPLYPLFITFCVLNGKDAAIVPANGR